MNKTTIPFSKVLDHTRDNEYWQALAGAKDSLKYHEEQADGRMFKSIFDKALEGVEPIIWEFERHKLWLNHLKALHLLPDRKAYLAPLYHPHYAYEINTGVTLRLDGEAMPCDWLIASPSPLPDKYLKATARADILTLSGQPCHNIAMLHLQGNGSVRLEIVPTSLWQAKYERKCKKVFK